MRSWRHSHPEIHALTPPNKYHAPAHPQHRPSSTAGLLHRASLARRRRVCPILLSGGGGHQTRLRLEYDSPASCHPLPSRALSPANTTAPAQRTNRPHRHLRRGYLLRNGGGPTRSSATEYRIVLSSSHHCPSAILSHHHQSQSADESQVSTPIHYLARKQAVSFNSPPTAPLFDIRQVTTHC